MVLHVCAIRFTRMHLGDATELRTDAIQTCISWEAARLEISVQTCIMLYVHHSHTNINRSRCANNMPNIKDCCDITRRRLSQIVTCLFCVICCSQCNDLAVLAAEHPVARQARIKRHTSRHTLTKPYAHARIGMRI